MMDFGSNMKTVLLKGLEAIGKGASSLTNSAQQKLDEMNVNTRCSELMKEIPPVALKLWQDGVPLPEELCSLLAEWDELTQKLNAMRNQATASANASSDATDAPTVEEKLKEMGEQIENAVENAADAIEQFVESTAEKVADAWDKATDEQEDTSETESTDDGCSDTSCANDEDGERTE